MPQVQPVNAGTAGSDATVVVVDGGGTGPVSDNTNVSYTLFPTSACPTARQSDALIHDTELSTSKLVPALGLDTIDHTDPFHTITNVAYAEPGYV
jgi:hypothetical protein